MITLYYHKNMPVELFKQSEFYSKNEILRNRQLTEYVHTPTKL